jgi:hypothetical protein
VPGTQQVHLVVLRRFGAGRGPKLELRAEVFTSDVRHTNTKTAVQQACPDAFAYRRVQLTVTITGTGGPSSSVGKCSHLRTVDGGSLEQWYALRHEVAARMTVADRKAVAG